MTIELDVPDPFQTSAPNPGKPILDVPDPFQSAAKSPPANTPTRPAAAATVPVLDVPDPFQAKTQATPAPVAALLSRSFGDDVSDLGTDLYGRLQRGAGQVVQGFADLGRKLDETFPLSRKLDELTGITPEATQQIGAGIQESGQRNVESTSPAFREETSKGLTEPGGLSAVNIASKTLGPVADIGAPALASMLNPVAGVASFGAQGEAQGREQGRARVDNLSDADIVKVPRFQQLLQSGLTPDDARAHLADEESNRQAVVQGLFGSALGAVGKIPGVEPLSGAIAKRFGGGAAARIAGTAAAEGAGFGGVNAAGQVAGNVSSELPTSPLEGVGEAAASGLLPGLALGAARRGIAELGARRVMSQPPIGAEETTLPQVRFPQAQPGSLADAANRIDRNAALQVEAPPASAIDPQVARADEIGTHIAELAQQHDLPQAAVDDLHARFNQPLPRDRVAGFYLPEQLDGTLRRAQQWVQQSGQPAVYIEGDFQNLNGLNAHVGSNSANEHLGALPNLALQRLEQAGADVIPIRKGGDEFAYIATGIPHDQVQQALSLARTDGQRYAAENGLQNVSNPKEQRSPGIGMHFGSAPITPSTPLGDIFSAADRQVEARKKGVLGYEFGSTSRTTGAQPSGEQSGRPEESALGRNGAGSDQSAREAGADADQSANRVATGDDDTGGSNASSTDRTGAPKPESGTADESGRGADSGNFATVKTSVGDVSVDRGHDVPLLGSSGKDGKVYIDKDWDPVIDDGPLKGLDRTPFLVEHEAVEARAEKDGQNYSQSHYDNAEPAEHKMLLDHLGLKAGTPEADKAIEAYESSYKSDLHQAAAKTNPKVPPDLIEKPYEHPHTQEQRRLLADVQDAEPNSDESSAAHNLVRPSGESSTAPTGTNRAGMSQAELVGALRDTVKKWGSDAPNVLVHHSHGEAPLSLRRSNGFDRRVEGAYDPRSNSIHLFADAIKTPERAQQVLAHEVIGHFGIEKVVGKDWKKLVDDVGAMRKRAPTAMKDVINEVEKRYPGANADTFASEAMAVMAEKNIKNAFTDRVYAAVRRFIRGLGIDLKFNDAELRQMLVAARRRVTSDSTSTATSRSANQAPRFSKSPAEAPTDDDLHAAFNIANKGTFSKEFTFQRTGDKTAVMHEGREVARVDGKPSRHSIVASIAQQLADRARAEQLRESARNAGEPNGEKNTPAKSELRDLPARRPGELQKDYALRVGRANAEDLRDATSLKSLQKTIGRHAIREMLAKRQRALDVADATLGEYRKQFDRLDPAENFANIDAWESGRELRDPTFRSFVNQMRVGFAERIERLSRLDGAALPNLIRHYIPHLYKDPARAAQWFNEFVNRRSLAGDKSFLKERSWPTLKEAMAAGLQPVTLNPADWVLLHYSSMDKYAGLLQLKKELSDRDWLPETKADEPPPFGYQRVSDPSFNGVAVPEPIARDINNYLTPGFSRFAPWRTLRAIQNTMVAADLGFSGFHGTFTSTDNVIMHLDVAMRRAAIGDSRGAAGTFLKALSSVVTSPIEGHRLNQQWRGLRDSDANTMAILDALERGGARWKMSPTDYQNAIPQIARTFRQMMGPGVAANAHGKTPGQIALGALKIPLTALQAAAEAGSYVIHHWLVPNQKMAARTLLYKYELDRMAEKLGQERGEYANIIDAMHPDVVRQLAAQVNDVVDFRLGQMVYDNRFWPRLVQDVAQAAVMAPGWQYGMLQTVFGAGKAVKDLASPTRLVAPLDRSGEVTTAHMGRVGSNLSYFITLAVTLGGAMSMLQYLLTGQPAQELRDYFYPKTGRKNDDDSDERLQFPNYWSDHYKVATDPGHTAMNKIHPFWKMVWEIGHNRDYFGTQIRNSDSPALEQAKTIAQYVASKFVPITIGNFSRGAEHNETATKQAGHFFGINHAPAAVSRSPFQDFVLRGGSKGWGDFVKTADEAHRKEVMHAAAAALRRGDPTNYADLSDADIEKAQEDSDSPVPQLLFKHLSNIDKIAAYELATPQERQRYGLRNSVERLNLEKSAPFKRLSATEQSQMRARLQRIRTDGP